MPAYFEGATSPMKFIEIDYEAFFKELEKTFGGFTFFPNWKKYWIDLFQEEDREIIDVIKNSPRFNPFMEKIKNQISNVPPNYRFEMFPLEVDTTGGPWNIHFDVENMKSLQHQNEVPIKEIPIDEIFVDSETPVIMNKLNDQRLPFVTRIYGSDAHFHCVDGNHRIQVRKKMANDKIIKAYVFDERHWEHMFFLSCDFHLMLLFRELLLMQNELVKQKSTEQDILKTTQLYEQQYNKQRIRKRPFPRLLDSFFTLIKRLKI